jgi:hypothetical protein
MNASTDLYFLIKPEDMRVSTTAGVWKSANGYVQIPASESSNFFISVEKI